MSIESVFEKCIQLRSDEEIEQIREKLTANIKKHKEKFEKATFTWWHEGESMVVYNMLAGDGKYKDMTATQVRRAMFEENKQELVHKHLTVLCDLFDYEKANS